MSKDLEKREQVSQCGEYILIQWPAVFPACDGPHTRHQEHTLMRQSQSSQFSVGIKKQLCIGKYSEIRATVEEAQHPREVPWKGLSLEQRKGFLE